MQKDNDSSHRRIITSVEVVDVPPIEPEDYVTITAASKDGSPHVTPVWAEMVDDFILINTFETSAKNKHITNDKRIAVSVVEQNNPFNMVSIKGKVIEQTTEGADEHLKGLAKKYLGIGKYYYRKPNHKRITIRSDPKR